MLKLAPFIIVIIYTLVSYKLSARASTKRLDQQSTILEDEDLGELCRDMARALGLPQIRCHVYEVEQINGLAAADGRIFITRGFLDRYKKGDVTAGELSSVIAHELGHVALGHSKRRLIDFTGQNAIRVVLASILGRFIPGAGMWLANLLTNLLAARLSRNDEFEADAYASALLTKAGIGTEPQKALFKKLDKLAGGGAGAPAWFLSHPNADKRIAAIEANEEKWGTNTLPETTS